MLRRIMIALVAIVAALTLATAPVGAGASSLELYSAPGYSGTHSSVPSTTVDDYLNKCVSVSTLTTSVLDSAQSIINDTPFTIELYVATGCPVHSCIAVVSPYTSWTTLSNEIVRSIIVRP